LQGYRAEVISFVRVSNIFRLIRPPVCTRGTSFSKGIGRSTDVLSLQARTRGIFNGIEQSAVNVNNEAKRQG
jgi:hypothetical protein